MDQHTIESLLFGIRDPAVRKAFSRVDRSRFVLPAYRDQAWEDHPLPIEDDATISQPLLVARMTELLEPDPEHRILEIGTGSGYQTALLAEIAREVFTIEVSALLSRHAEERLGGLGYTNIHFRIGDGRFGWPEAAPFDRILATVAFSSLPDFLEQQLADGGILLAPIGPVGGIQALRLYRKEDGRLTQRSAGAVRFLSAYA